ncbi:MAG: FHA domain-containing protein [Lachnospiraceae bacterium]|nr:FHA domain-containing protein [Lachnospiraceae bacterium]
MAQVVQCPGGHYYDVSVFQECPHCKDRLEQGWENSVSGNRDEIARMARRYLQEKKIGRDIRQAFEKKNRDHGEDAEEEFQGKEELLRKKDSLRQEEDPGKYESPRRDEVQRNEEIFRKEEPQSPENEVTVAFHAPKQSSYFVTGWIVCVDGPDKGHVFSLYQGYHSIGYGRKNQICLLEDLDIAKGVHCYLVYDDKKNRFYLVPEGDNHTFLNGELLSGPTEIFTGDDFRLGNSMFEFVAFCKDDRKWEWKDIYKRG